MLRVCFMFSVKSHDLFQFRNTIKKSYLGSGNRCGHDPKNPDFKTLDFFVTEKRLPPTQATLIDSVKAYYDNPRLLPSLYQILGSKNKDGRFRSNRSCIRDAEVRVLKALLSFTDFTTLKVGVPCANGDFINRHFGEIAKLADLLDKRSTPDMPIPNRRFYRVIKRLKDAGILKVDKQYKVIEGEFDLTANGTPKPKIRALYSIKTISQDFLLSLGTVSLTSLKVFRDWCSNDYKKKRDKFKAQNVNARTASEARKRLKFKSEIGGDITAATKRVNLNKKSQLISGDDKKAYALARADLLSALRTQYPDKAREFPWLKARVNEQIPTIEIWLAKQRR